MCHFFHFRAHRNLPLSTRRITAAFLPKSVFSPLLSFTKSSHVMILRSSKDADFGDVDGDASADVFGGYSKRALGLSLLADVLMSIGEVVVNRF